MIRASTELCGTATVLSVRLPALLCLTATWLMVAALTRDVSRDRGATPDEATRTAVLAVLMVQFAPILAVFSAYISTDPPLIACWTAVLWLGYRALAADRWRDWLGLGVALALAANAKFVAGLLVPSALLFLLLARGRIGTVSLLRPALTILIAAIGVVPIVAWNATHDWSTFHFNLVSRQDVVEARWHDPPVYLLGQAVALSPVLFLLLAAGVAHAGRQGLKNRDRSATFLFAFAAVPLAAFLYTSFTRTVSPHWPTVAWIAAIVHVAAEQRHGAGFRRPRATRWAVASAVALTLTMIGVAQVPQRHLDYDVAWFGRPRKIRVKALAERYGWEELGRSVANARDAMTDRTGETPFLAATRYGLAAATAFYTPGGPHVHLWCSPRDHGDHYRFWDDWDDLRGRDAIVVVKRRVEGELPHLRESFARVEPPQELQIVDPERPDFVIRSFWLVYCHDFGGTHPFARSWPAQSATH